MATWPSGSKASTTNLDSGADKPSLARADLKQNVDNVNAIIDMFNIASPSDNQILKYDAANSRFDLATDSGGIANVVEDTTPQLGGDLDVNGNSIVNSSIASPDLILEAGDGGDVFINAGTFRPVEGINLNNSDLFISTSGESYNVKIQGITYPKTDGTNGQFLKTDGSGVLSFVSINQATGDEIESLVEDTSPQLGGNLDLNGNTITAGENQDITITPVGGTGVVNIGSGYNNTTINGATLTLATGMGGKIVLQGYYATEVGNIEVNGTISSPTNTDITLTAGGTGKVVLGSSLNVNGQSIVSASNGNIAITPNGTGSIVLDGLNWPQADGTADQVLKTNGSGQLSFATLGGGGSSISVAMLYNNPYQFQSSPSHTAFYDYGAGYRLNFYEATDTDSIVTTSNGQFTLGAGTYTLLLSGPLGFDENATGVLFYNSTSSSTIYEWFIPQIEWGSTDQYTVLSSFNYVVSPGSSTTYEYRLPSLSSTTSQGAFTLIIMKLS